MTAFRIILRALPIALTACLTTGALAQQPPKTAATCRVSNESGIEITTRGIESNRASAVVSARGDDADARVFDVFAGTGRGVGFERPPQATVAATPKGPGSPTCATRRRSCCAALTPTSSGRWGRSRS